MKFPILSILILVLAALFQLVLPWWSIALAAALMAFFLKTKALYSFFAGFLGLFLLWCGYALYLNTLDEGLLAGKMGQLIGGLGSVSLALVTGLIGGLLGGLGALTGSLGRQVLRRAAQ